MRSKFIFCVILSLLIQIVIYGQPTQTITVDVDTKGTENRIYTYSPGSGERAVIDLGHFNSESGSVKNIKLATVTVSIDMLEGDSCSTSEKTDISVINLDRLESFSFSNYDVTKFLGKSDGSMTLKISNLKILTPNIRVGGEVFIGCHNGDTKHFKYQFDLVVDLNSLEKESMYGFSPKNRDNKGYLNIKDIVLEQISYSNIGK